MRILESEFFAEDKRIIEKKKLVPDERIKASFDSALQQPSVRRSKHCGPGPMMPTALFTLSLVSGLRADYTAFIEKRQFQSLYLDSPVTNVVLATVEKPSRLCRTEN